MLNVIIDLDETLIHTLDISQKSSREAERLSDFHFTIDGYHYYVQKRPGLEMFLDFVFKHFNVGIWTAADKEYAKAICKRILSEQQLHKIKFIYSRNFCHLDHSEKPPIFTKPLSKLFNLYPEFTPENTIIIDNTFDVMKYNPHNGIHIPDFNKDSYQDPYLYHVRNAIIKYYQRVPINTPVWGMVYEINKMLQIL